MMTTAQQPITDNPSAGRLLTISWFSAGVSSAVATKLGIDDIDEVIYTHIDDQHPDTLRFVQECRAWFGMEVRILQSPYRTVENAIRANGFVSGPHGAPCTRYLKKRVRQEWELEQTQSLRYVWGMDNTERARADRIRSAMPAQEHLFPLLDQNISKAEAHRILAASGIKRPAMYDLGYHNNNCVGCVRGGMGYWNKIRRDFPDVFSARAKMERVMGGSCINGIYLDELGEDRGRHKGPICKDCGIFCEIMGL